jgi:hypothetical protein
VVLFTAGRVLDAAGKVDLMVLCAAIAGKPYTLSPQVGIFKILLSEVSSGFLIMVRSLTILRVKSLLLAPDWGMPILQGPKLGGACKRK